MKGLVTIYPYDTCEPLEIVQEDIGQDGFVYTTDGAADAGDLCTAGHNDGGTYTAVRSDKNTAVWACVPPSAEVTDTPEPRVGCIRLLDTMYLLFPESNYLSGAISTYSDNQCENENLGSVTVEGDGVVHTTEGQVAAEALCKAGRNDGSDYSVQASVFNHNYYKCTRLTPVATDTETSAPSATDTPAPTATDTPTSTLEPMLPSNTPTPTDSPVPPSNTPSPTNTPVPPTNTPAPKSIDAQGTIVWSADMLVVDYLNGAIGAPLASLFTNQAGSGGLQATRLWYYAPKPLAKSGVYNGRQYRRVDTLRRRSGDNVPKEWFGRLELGLG